MKKHIAVALFALTIFSCKTDKKQETPAEKESMKQQTFYLGTYTDGDSEGIYKYALLEDGTLSKIGLLAKVENPSFLALSKDGKTLLAVNENENGSIESFAIENDSLTKESHSETGGAHPCFVNVNADGDVLAANYTGGNIGLLKLDGNKLSDLKFVEQHEGSGTDERQSAPHAHSTWFLPGSEKDFVSVDLGTNELWFSTIKNDSIKLKNKLMLPEGVGPRHLVFHPTEDWIYVVNELISSVTLIKKDGDNYTIASTVSTLPEDFEGESFCADIHISKDGKFVYASNRGHETIAVFKVQENGDLEALEYESVRGEHPRNFALSPDEDFLLVANKNANNIVSYKRDANTGMLDFVSEIAAPSPVCILFD